MTVTKTPGPARATRIELAPELVEQLRGLILAVRAISHGPLSDLEDAGPVQPLGLEGLTMAVDRHAEALTIGLSAVASALTEVADAIRARGSA